MIRIAHTACVALLVTVVLVAYGVKQETRELERRVEELKAQKAAVAERIAMLETEWDHLNSPTALRRLAARLYGEGRILGVDGEPLTPLGPEQALDLGAPRSAADRSEAESLPTGAIDGRRLGARQ